MSRLIDKIVEIFKCTFIYIFVLGFMLAASAGIGIMNYEIDKPEIIDIDGKAYIYKNGYICNLLDENGNELNYTENINKEHEFKILRENKDCTFIDKNTNIAYNLVTSDDNTVIRTEIMYKQSDIK